MSRPFLAAHPGRCHADCGQWIDRGDAIRMTDDGAVHADCAAPAPVERAEPEACTTCWLTHPEGACDR